MNYRDILKQTCVDYMQMNEFLINPLIFKKGKGIYLWDINNKKYIDALSGVFVCIFGHNYKPINQALTKQLNKLSFFPGLHGTSDATLKFVEDLSSITPGNLNFVKAYTGGSEANEAAMKFAKQYHTQTNSPGKYKVLSLNLSYHGGTFATTSISGLSKRRVKYEPLTYGHIKVPSPYQVYSKLKRRNSFNPTFEGHYFIGESFDLWKEANQICADILEDTIINEHPDTISSFIIEPICSTAGIIEPSLNYFKTVRNLCDKYNIMLIFDEVLTGVAKTGKMFATEYTGICPDIITIAKSISNGTVPLSAFAVDTKYSDAFLGPWSQDSESVQFHTGITYAGMPVASAVGSAVINEVLTNDYIQKATNIGIQLREKLESLRKYDFVIDVRGRGSLLCVEINNDYFHKRYKNFTSFGDYFKKTTLENGLIVRIDPHWFTLSPPLISTKEEIDELFRLLEKSIEDVVKKWSKPGQHQIKGWRQNVL